MSRARWVLGATIFAVVCIRGAESLWAGEAPRVSSGPTVTKEGQGFAVAFSVSEPCDVTVRIVDSNGKVVRHLAGGMVGLTAAAEPLRPKSLSQRLTWDGRDDSGKDVAAVGCKALVGVGLKAKFDKFILWEPDGYDRARKDLARVLKGNDDEYLVSQHWGVHMTTTRVFNAQGKFVRQIWPPSLNKPKEKLTRLLSEPMVGGDDWEDRRVPMCVNHNSTYHFGTAWPVLVTRDGSLLGVHGYVSDYLGLWMLDPEGFPVKWAWYPPWQPRQQSVFTKTLWKFAAGPDGDVYLADGIHHVVGHFRVKDMSPVESFKFSGKEELETPRSYIGEVNLNYQAKWQRGPDWKEKPIIDDESHFLGPADVALDKDGQLLVLDGKLDKRGVIEGEAKVKVYARDGRYVKTVDKSAFPASDAAVPEAVAAAGGNDRAVCFPHFLRVDSQGRLYVKNQGMGKGFIVTDVDGKGFRVPRLPWGWASSQGYTCVDAEDNWYVAVGRKNEASRLWKYAPDGKQLKFGDADALLIEKDWEIKGACVAPGGDIYVVVTTDKWKVTREVTKVCAFGDLTGRGQEVCQTRVDVYGPDATLKKKGVVMSVAPIVVALTGPGAEIVGAETLGAETLTGW